MWSHWGPIEEFNIFRSSQDGKPDSTEAGPEDSGSDSRTSFWEKHPHLLARLGTGPSFALNDLLCNVCMHCLVCKVLSSVLKGWALFIISIKVSIWHHKEDVIVCFFCTPPLSQSWEGNCPEWTTLLASWTVSGINYFQKFGTIKTQNSKDILRHGSAVHLLRSLSSLLPFHFSLSDFLWGEQLTASGWI